MKFDIDHLTESELIHLNEKVIQRLRMIRQMRAHVQMLGFQIGERVWFQTERDEIVRGMVARYNKKSVTVVTDDGHRWPVSPTFLRRTASGPSTCETGNVIEIEGARGEPRNVTA
jgi:hypothetical protein